MVKKINYTTPSTKIYEVQIQTMLMGSPYHLGGAGSYGDDETNDNGDY